MSETLGVPYLLVEPVNELRAKNIPPLCVVRIITDGDPLAFQNLDEILPNVDRIIISQLPIIPKEKELLRLARDGRVLAISCTSDSFRTWFQLCKPYRDPVLAIGGDDPERLNS
jgi:hypothetical protein